MSSKAKIEAKTFDIIEVEPMFTKKFTKQQVLASTKLSYSKDLINAVLDENESYTLKEVEAEIKRYLKGKVS